MTKLDDACAKMDALCSRMDAAETGVSFKSAKSQLASLGIELKADKDWEEYIVNFKGGRAATSYHTDDLNDALATGKRMAEKGAK